MRDTAPAASLLYLFLGHLPTKNCPIPRPSGVALYLAYDLHSMNEDPRFLSMSAAGQLAVLLSSPTIGAGAMLNAFSNLGLTEQSVWPAAVGRAPHGASAPSWSIRSVRNIANERV